MASTKLFLFIGKTYQSGESPILLRVTHQRKHRYISLGYSCKPSQWDKAKSRLRRNYPQYKAKNQVLRKFEDRAESVLDDFNKFKLPFTFQSFEDKFLNNKITCPVYPFFDVRIEEATKLNTKGTYQQTKNALWKFAPNKDLMFSDIDYQFLKKFESHLFNRENISGGGVHFYMRTLRAIINQAISRDFLPRELYPFANQFNKNGYSLSHLKSTASPRALSEIDIEKIKNFPFEKHPAIRKEGYYFLFSYYARGMNFTDMAKLQWSDIYKDRIHYTRSKTGGNLNIKISTPLQEILNYFKKEFPSDANYVFPVFSAFHQSESQKKYRIQKCLKQYNDKLKEIAELLDIAVNMTSYTARHTYATTLKRKGVNTAVISEGLGHKDISTTKAYLKKFDTDIIDKSDEVL
jgi:integrase